ncbi:MAG: hypothetical protein ACK46Q_03815 [Hyphomonas sp.]
MTESPRKSSANKLNESPEKIDPGIPRQDKIVFEEEKIVEKKSHGIPKTP